MKVTNQKAKMFIIPTKTGKFRLLPASGEVELPNDYSESYVNALAENGSITISGVEQVEDSDDEELEELLQAEYEELSGDKADGRWSAETLQEKIDELKA